LSAASARPSTDERLNDAEAVRVACRRLWGAVVLCRSVDVLDSVLAGRPVPAHQLDVVVLQRALRGGRLPDPGSWFRVRAGHLDAICEAGLLR
jgi:hypothetical protein